MKKRFVAVMLGMTIMMTAVTGCGSKENSGTAESTEIVESTEAGEESTEKEKVTAASSVFDLKGSDYAKLCDYNAVEITITGDYDVTDEGVQEYFAEMFESYGPFYTEDADKTTIEEGDIVDVDYVGKLDGVAFDGGSAEHQLIDVYNNSSATGSGYIEGFTDGLKGASVGDVIDCDATFPEDYGNTELAGKDVVFTFTVNSIQKEMTIDEVDDEFAKEQFQVDTVDEMYAQIREYMVSAAEYNKERDTYLALQNYLVDNCTVEAPEDYVSARVSDYKKQYIDQYCGGDESQLETYLSDYYGKTVAEMEEYWTEAMGKSVALELIMDAIVDELAITVDEEEFDAYVQQIVSNNGYESEDAMYEMYGYGDTAYGARYFKELYTYDLALEEILKTATVNIEEPAAETEEETEQAEETAEETEQAKDTAETETTEAATEAVEETEAE